MVGRNLWLRLCQPHHRPQPRGPTPRHLHPLPRPPAASWAIERRLGLFPTAARAIYDARAAAGFPVSAADRLGDTFINGASKTGRHNLFNRAWRLP